MYQHSDTLPDEQAVHSVQRRVLSFRAPATPVARLGENIGKPVVRQTKSGWNR